MPRCTVERVYYSTSKHAESKTSLICDLGSSCFIVEIDIRWLGLCSVLTICSGQLAELGSQTVNSQHKKELGTWGLTNQTFWLLKMGRLNLGCRL